MPCAPAFPLRQAWGLAGSFPSSMWRLTADPAELPLHQDWSPLTCSRGSWHLAPPGKWPFRPGPQGPITCVPTLLPKEPEQSSNPPRPRPRQATPTPRLVPGDHAHGLEPSPSQVSRHRPRPPQTTPRVFRLRPPHGLTTPLPRPSLSPRHATPRPPIGHAPQVGPRPLPAFARCLGAAGTGAGAGQGTWSRPSPGTAFSRPFAASS